MIVVFGAGLKLHSLNLWISNNSNNDDDDTITVFPLKGGSSFVKICVNINPLTPKISLVFLLTVCHISSYNASLENLVLDQLMIP